VGFLKKVLNLRIS